MNDDNTPHLNSAQKTDSQGEDLYPVHEQVFDISADTISPINDDVPGAPVVMQPQTKNVLPTDVLQSQPIRSDRPAQYTAPNKPDQSVRYSAAINLNELPSPKSTLPSNPSVPPNVDFSDKTIGTLETIAFAPTKNPIEPFQAIAQPINIPAPKPIYQEKAPVPAFNSNLPKIDRKLSDFPRAQNIPAPIHSTPNNPAPLWPETPHQAPMKPVENQFEQNQQPVRRPINLIDQPASQTDSSTPRQGVTLVQKKPAPIPLQDITAQLSKFTGRNLQDEVSSVLTSKNPPPKPEPTIQKTETPPTPPFTQNTFTNNAKMGEAPQPINDDGYDGKYLTDVAKPLRTYEGDVAEIMSHRKISTASIAIAENKKQEGEEKLVTHEEPSHAGRKIAVVVLSIIFIFGGIAGAYYLFTISALAPAPITTPQQQASVSIIPSNNQVTVTVDTQNISTTLSRIQSEISKTQPSNTIKELIPAAKKSGSALTRLTTAEMIDVVDITAPDILTRSLTKDWMLGVYNDPNNEKSVFVVVTSNFFQNTFAGMLQWESVMADELKQYLYPTEPAGISNKDAQKDSGALPYVNPLNDLSGILPSTASSTKATSTPTTPKTTSKASTTLDAAAPLRSFVSIRGKFEDRIIKNRDVREFRTDAGVVLFLYSFIDNSHLVITSKESTLSEILSRLEKQGYLR